MTTAAPHTELPVHAPAAGPDYADDIGDMLLSLSINGETDGYTWAELEHLVELRIEDRRWAELDLINGVLDKLAGGG